METNRNATIKKSKFAFFSPVFWWFRPENGIMSCFAVEKCDRTWRQICMFKEKKPKCKSKKKSKFAFFRLFLRQFITKNSTIPCFSILVGNVTSQDAFAQYFLVDLPTVGLKLIFEFVDRLIGRNTVPQVYILWFRNYLWVR